MEAGRGGADRRRPAGLSGSLAAISGSGGPGKRRAFCVSVERPCIHLAKRDVA
jgi:hypothetical protein